MLEPIKRALPGIRTNARVKDGVSLASMWSAVVVVLSHPVRSPAASAWRLSSTPQSPRARSHTAPDYWPTPRWSSPGAHPYRTAAFDWQGMGVSSAWASVAWPVLLIVPASNPACNLSGLSRVRWYKAKRDGGNWCELAPSTALPPIRINRLALVGSISNFSVKELNLPSSNRSLASLSVWPVSMMFSAVFLPQVAVNTWSYSAAALSWSLIGLWVRWAERNHRGYRSCCWCKYRTCWPPPLVSAGGSPFRDQHSLFISRAPNARWKGVSGVWVPVPIDLPTMLPLQL